MTKDKTEIVLFESSDKSVSLPVELKDETVWLNVSQMAILFNREESNIRRHVLNVFKEKEVEENNNVQKIHVNNVKKPVPFYSLDVIISVGYRVKSNRGVEFRRWANAVLKKYILQGYAVNQQRIQQLGEVIRIMKRTENELDPIQTKADKQKWKEFYEQLVKIRKQKTVDVLKVVIESGLISVPPNISAYYDMYFTTPDLCYCNTTIKEFLDLEYEQFLAAINFLHPEADFSTEHGVKGEEYDNVIFVISKGWNQYQFETYAPMIKNGYPQDKEASYIRNHNLFYVCCSRPKKRLIFFVSVKIDDTFRDFLSKLVGDENIMTYEQYMSTDWRESEEIE